ncbi:MAG: choice-of-anchor D domain-containing protein [Deltaproteobacteria bacterium]|nr:choice-of-anchor D domain-containing protein [Deltaproteobacteria bacterium]
MIQQVVLFRALSLALILAACEGQTFTRLSPPLLLVNTDELQFGQIPVGFEVSKSLTLANKGDTPLEVRSLRIENAAVFFVPSTALTIAPGLDATISVQFEPVAAAPYQGKLVIESSAQNSPTHEVQLMGEGVPVKSCGDCNTPPRPMCLTEHHRVTYSETGTCVNDRCEYTANSEPCARGCDSATRACVGAPPDDAGVRDAVVGVDARSDASIGDATADAGPTDLGVTDSGLPGPNAVFDSPGEHAYTVPPGVTELRVRAWGGGGQGGNQDGATGGGGGFVGARVVVTPGESLDVWVAEGGGLLATSLGNGGGATYLRRGATELIVAAGGGGGGSDGNSGNSMAGGQGGAGGGLEGEAGANGIGAIATYCTGVTGGTAGTQSAGGLGGTSSGTAANQCPGQPGARNIGGRATGVNGSCDANPGAHEWHMGGGQANGGGGGGGAGYFGGGGAGFIWTYCGGGGGGGSSYAAPTLLEVTHLAGHLTSPGNASEASGAAYGGQRCQGRAQSATCLDPNGGNGRLEIRY